MAAELVVMGGGQMGEALVGGLLAAGWARPEAVVLVEPLAARRHELAARHPGLVVTDQPAPAAGAVVAVKPPDVRTACGQLAEAGVPRVLSIAAGVPLRDLETWLAAGRPGPPAVLRGMPNTPALIGAGASAVAPGSTAGPDDLAWATAVLGAVGTVVTVGEHLLDAVTGLSGSGPAYVFLLVEALVDAGVLVGLPRPVARDLATQTLLGSARLLAESGEAPETLRARVTSPGGTTAAGLRALEAGAVRSAVTDAVVAATRRSAELAGN